MRFGCHVSIKNGYLGAAKLAKDMGGTAFQYFPKNPRSLSVKDWDRADAQSCKAFCKEYGLMSISHSPYPTNLTPSASKKQQVIESLLNDLEISETCGSVGVVVHFGKDKDENNPLSSYQLMIETLNTCLEQWDGVCKILLENIAGVTGTMGTTLEELVQVRKLTNYPEKIGFCFDTCHAFASGIWNGENWEILARKAEELDYFSNLEAIHLNNSKYETGSGKDRHANIFQHGKINKNQWSNFLQTPEFRDLPLILETPDEYGITHQQEINMLYQEWGSKTGK